MNALPSRARAWCEIIRPPNLFTVPGDPLAGFFLAVCMAGAGNPWRALFPALAALFLYVGGLIGNDVADLEEDALDRPHRPIPSRRVSRAAAFTASALAAVVGLVIALGAGFPTFGMACLTQIAIMAYNGWLKRFAILGSLGMGACRGLSFLMGVAAAHPRLLDGTPVLVAAAGVTIYIAGVTWIADRETTEERIGPRRWVPLLSLLICLPWIAVLTRRLELPFGGLGAVAAGWALYQGVRLRGVPTGPVLGAAIGGLIRGLLLIQAAFCSLGGVPGLVTAIALLVLWPLSVAVAKRFYAT